MTANLWKSESRCEGSFVLDMKLLAFGLAAIVFLASAPTPRARRKAYGAKTVTSGPGWRAGSAAAARLSNSILLQGAFPR